MTVVAVQELPDPFEVTPLLGPVDAVVRPPGSKSITNRALVCAALADGTSELHGALLADDTEAMLGGLGELGIRCRWEAERVVVEGCAGRPAATGAVLDARLSGTTSRFLAPLALVGPATVVLDGAPPLRRRPMGDLLEALRGLGAQVVELGEPGHLPVELGTGGRGLQGGAVRVRGAASSQFLSGLLLAGPALPAGLEVEVVGELVSVPYVRMTIEVMRAFGAVVEHDPAFRRLRVAPGGYVARRFDVEPDASAASYFLAAAALTAGRVIVPGLGSDSLQGDVGFADVLVRMGAAARVGAGGLEVVGPEQLRGIEVDLGDLSDTAQTLAAVAPFADSPTVVKGIGFIRAKETDRIAAVVAELRRLGVDAQEGPDGFTVHPGSPHGGLVRTYDDHRMAMSFALIGLRVPGILIADPGCVAKTYPRFWDDLRNLQTRQRGPGTGTRAGGP